MRGVPRSSLVDLPQVAVKESKECVDRESIFLSPVAGGPDLTDVKGQAVTFPLSVNDFMRKEQCPNPNA